MAGRLEGRQAAAEKVCLGIGRRLERHRATTGDERHDLASGWCCRSGGKRNMSLRNSIGLSIVIFLVLLAIEKCHSANTDELTGQSEREVGE